MHAASAVSKLHISRDICKTCLEYAQPAPAPAGSYFSNFQLACMLGEVQHGNAVHADDKQGAMPHVLAQNLDKHA